jgi:hypothetical protein
MTISYGNAEWLAIITGDFVPFRADDFALSQVYYSQQPDY